MATYTQANRPMSITTPLGKDVLLLTGFEGEELISGIFRFSVALLAEKETAVKFDAILGQSVTVELEIPGGDKRYVDGIVSRFTQGERDETFTHFRAEIVPRLWLLTRKSQSRIFQHLTIPDILKKVLTGFAVSFQIVGKYEPRDYCAQYCESDFDFASRLMEEEGIYYFFKHSKGNHEMVVTDASKQHPDVPGPSSVIYEEKLGGMRDETRVIAWEKTQELRSGKYTLWDHCFELPGNNLEAKQTLLDAVTVGTVSHKLKVGVNDPLEIYDYPGGYAQRFDGINKSGGEQPSEIQKIFVDKQRTVNLRMEQEGAPSIEVKGRSYCRHFTAGHKFALERHFDADGPYVLTRVEHRAQLDGNYRSASEIPFRYGNRFTAIPIALPYRPRRRTARPTIGGAQTATVVGPPGEEIFVDKYGRVKVQFHWDREGRKNQDSSCWVRVAQVWAGKTWGAFFWPRIGNEVVVTFEEGDPDRPLITGSVYNAENLPPFVLPFRNELAGIKSASVRGKVFSNFNGIVFNDAKGHEHLAIHSERNMSFNSEFDKMFHSGRHKAESVSSASTVTIGRLPGGGGSGGGDGWPKPTPQGIGGLNSMVVYGENLQIAVGLNHQLALGSNIQICINPAGLAAGIPGTPVNPTVSGFLGAGLGGNLQLTIGTSASFVLGRSFDINLGPPKISVDVTDQLSHLTSYLLCVLLSGIALAWVIAYDLMDDANQRATGALIFQVAVDAVLAFLMIEEMDNKKAQLEADNLSKQTLYDTLTTRWKTEKHSKELEDQIAQASSNLSTAHQTEDELFGSGPGGDFPNFCQGLLWLGVIGAGVLPLVGVAWEEQSKFDLSDEDQDKAANK